MLENTQQLEKILKNGGLVVMPTDTIYGICGSALNKETVENIYKIRQRDTQKPMIVLISSLKDLSLFDIKIDEKTKKIMGEFWPEKVSLVLPCLSEKFDYLHRGKKSLAFRYPAKKDLTKLLQKTGPLVAPSANPEKKPPAKTVSEAKKYFGDKVNYYFDAGELGSPPSKVIAIQNGEIKVLRK